MRRALCALVLAGLLASFLAVAGPADDASALVGPPAPVPTIHAGAAALGSAVAGMGVAGTISTAGTVCATGAGCVILGLSSVAIAGYALGYNGAKLACNITGFAGTSLGSCSDYEFTESAPGGFASSPYGPCPSFGTGAECSLVSWDELGDFGPPSARVFSLAQAHPDASGYPQLIQGGSTGMGGCQSYVDTAAYPAYVTPSGIYGSSGSLSCSGGGHRLWYGAPSNDPVEPPYRQGALRSVRLCKRDVPGKGNCGIEPGDQWVVHGLGSGVSVGTDGAISAPRYAQGIPVSDEVNRRGSEGRLVVTAHCRVTTESARSGYGPGSTEIRSSYGSWAFVNEGPEAPPSPCLQGDIPTRVEIDWNQYRRDQQLSSTTTPTQTTRVVEWSSPAEWVDPSWPYQQNVKKQDDPAAVATVVRDPSTDDCMWGELAAASDSWCGTEPGLGVTPDPTDVEDPAPDPTTPTTTVPPPRGPQDTEPVPAGDAGETSCWTDGWSWNPVSWVLIPVKCALLWAFWDQDTADEIGELWGDTVGPWVEAVTGTLGSISFSAAAGPCIDMGVAEVCTSGLLGVTMPESVVVFFVALMTFTTVFEVIGLFARVTGAGR